MLTVKIMPVKIMVAFFLNGNLFIVFPDLISNTIIIVENVKQFRNEY